MKTARPLRLRRAVFAWSPLSACAQSPGATAGSPAAAAPRATAIFAGGCFWCIEKDFEKLPGVIEVESGYTGGRTPNPTYETVSDGSYRACRSGAGDLRPGHGQLSAIGRLFLAPHRPDGQGPPVLRRRQAYRSAIYWQNDAERQVAEASRDELLSSGRFRHIYTELAPAAEFWRAEEYHQDYYKKNPVRYAYYRRACGRDARVAELWGAKL